jgi:hypothetical protein
MNPCDVTFNQPHDSEIPIEAVFAGTLCLMSCCMQTGSMMYIPKLIDNLDVIASIESASAEMRAVCRKLSCHWQNVLDAHQQSEMNDQRKPMVVDQKSQLH